LQFGKSANQILIVDEVLAVGFRLGERYTSERDAEFQKMPGQNEGCRRPQDSLELKKGAALHYHEGFGVDKR
jgi:hypothetical protein